MIQRVLLEGRREYDTYGYVDVSGEDIVHPEREEPNPINSIAAKHLARAIFEQPEEGDYDFRRYMSQFRAKLAQILEVMPEGYEPDLSGYHSPIETLKDVEVNDGYIAPPPVIVEIKVCGRAVLADVGDEPTEVSDWLVTDPDNQLISEYFDAVGRRPGKHEGAQRGVSREFSYYRPSFTEWLEHESRSQDPYTLATT